jgi:hypothetical protein
MASSPANRRDKRPEAHRLAAEGDIDGSFSFSPPLGTEPFYYLYYYDYIILHLFLRHYGFVRHLAGWRTNECTAKRNNII